MDLAENTLKKVLEKRKVKSLNLMKGWAYGPKSDFHLKDSWEELGSVYNTT